MKTVKYNVIFSDCKPDICSFGNFLVSFFTQEIEIKNFAKNALHIMSIGFLWNRMVMINASTDRRYMDSNCKSFWILVIPDS
jgi:hypothetical protein